MATRKHRRDKVKIRKKMLKEIVERKKNKENELQKDKK